MPASEKARATVYAVKKLRKMCGPHAAWRYAEKRGASKEMFFYAMRIETNKELRAQGFCV